MVLQVLTNLIGMDVCLDIDEQKNIDWCKFGESLMQSVKKSADELREHEHSRCVELLCQFVSNKYFPITQTDQRKMRERWINSLAPFISNDYLKFKSTWYEEAQQWQPQTAERLFHLTPKKLRFAYECLARIQEHDDPLADWYQLTQFISVSKRLKLKGDALRAETLRAGAHMLRLLHQDLYEEVLPLPNEVGKDTSKLVPELSVRKDPLRHLEFVVNLYNLNPQPKLSLFVEGESEVDAVQKIFESFYEKHPGKYGIELINLHGVNVATGTKKDRFRAIFRLIDYLHSHQTLTFLILDNENYARRLEEEARKAKSTYSDQRYVTQPDHIHIWNKAFEFDNFSCSEIAVAMDRQVENHDKPADDDAKPVKNRAKFTEAEVKTCKTAKNPGLYLQKLYNDKTDCDLDKPELCEILVENMMLPNSACKIMDRPIMKILERVRQLAFRNPFPISEEHSEINQDSELLGMKRKTKTK